MKLSNIAKTTAIILCLLLLTACNGTTSDLPSAEPPAESMEVGAGQTPQSATEEPVPDDLVLEYSFYEFQGMSCPYPETWEVYDEIPNMLTFRGTENGNEVMLRYTVAAVGETSDELLSGSYDMENESLTSNSTMIESNVEELNGIYLYSAYYESEAETPYYLCAAALTMENGEIIVMFGLHYEQIYLESFKQAVVLFDENNEEMPAPTLDELLNNEENTFVYENTTRNLRFALGVLDWDVTVHSKRVVCFLGYSNENDVRIWLEITKNTGEPEAVREREIVLDRGTNKTETEEHSFNDYNGDPVVEYAEIEVRNEQIYTRQLGNCEVSVREHESYYNGEFSNHRRFMVAATEDMYLTMEITFNETNEETVDQIIEIMADSFFFGVPAEEDESTIRLPDNPTFIEVKRYCHGLVQSSSEDLKTLYFAIESVAEGKEDINYIIDYSDPAATGLHYEDMTPVEADTELGQAFIEFCENNGQLQADSITVTYQGAPSSILKEYLISFNFDYAEQETSEATQAHTLHLTLNEYWESIFPNRYNVAIFDEWTLFKTVDD